MSIFDDPRRKLQWLEDELEEEIPEEEDEEEAPSRRYRHNVWIPEPEDMGSREAVFVEKKKRDKAVKRLKFLAFLEILAILAVIWGWIKWLY